jgi:septal ring-binding cell division protein DamX
MFCDNCGNKIPDDSLFCPVCGHPVTNYDYVSTGHMNNNMKIPDDTEKNERFISQTNRSKSWKRKAAATTLIAAALLVTVIILAYSFHKPTENQTDNISAKVPVAKNNSVAVSSQSVEEPEPTDSTEKPLSVTATPNMSDVEPKTSDGSATQEAPKEESESPSMSPFFGVWVTGSKDPNECEAVAAELTEKGFAGKVYVTTDWENLNQEKWYVVSAGEYPTEGEAEQILAQVKAEGYADAYVKYTGSHK